MTLLVREDLLKEMETDVIENRLVVVPLLDETQVGPGTIDLRLGTEFIETQRHAEAVVDPYQEPRDARSASDHVRFVPLGDHLVLHPGQFVLGATLEFVRLPAHLGAQVLSRSSWGRLGLLVATAVVVQPGFAGCLTLELVNTGSVPIRLRPGLRVAQLQIWSANTATVLPYSTGGGKYQAPLGPESTKLAWENDELRKLKSIGDRLLGRH